MADLIAYLSIAIGILPAATLVTQLPYIRLNIQYALFAASYVAFGVNEIALSLWGRPFFVYHIFIDAAVFSVVILALVNVEPRRLKIPSHYVFHFVLFYLGMLGMLPLMPLASAESVGTISAILIAIVIIFGLAVIAPYTNKRVAVGGIIVLAAWGGAHLYRYSQPEMLNRILTLAMMVCVCAAMLHHAYFVNKSTFYENTFLFRSQRVVLTMLNDISSSAEYISSVEKTLLRVLETVRETISAGGVALYEYREIEGGLPELRYAQSCGRFFPLRREDEITLKYQQMMLDRIAETIFGVGEGVVGTVAKSGNLLSLNRDEHHDQMAELGLDVRHIRNILAAPLCIKDKFYGVVVAQNCRDKPSFDENDAHFLKALADQAGISINNTRMYVEFTQTVRFREEANIATRIQKQLLPEKVPTLANVGIAVFFAPAKEVGGDYYDFIKHPDGSYGIVIGDVSGKGVPAGMVMAVAKAIVQILAKESSIPRDIVVRFASEMFGNMRSGQFMTFNYIRWDDDKRTLSFAGAGHEYILWFHADKGQCEKIRTGGVAVGLLEDVEQYVSHGELQLKKGDVVLLYTDGVTEARNAAKEMFTLRRLQSTLENYAYLARPEQICENIMRELHNFMGNTEQYDDITLVVLSVQA